MRGLMPFAAVSHCFIFLDCMLRTLGHPRFAMIMIVATTLFDICLTIVFVTQFDMGIFGVGLGTGISITIGFIVSGFVVFKQLHRNFNLTFLKNVGKEGVAAFAVTNDVIFIGTSILLGVSDGAIPVVSYNYGANSWHRVRQALIVVLRTNFIIGVIFFLLLWSFGEYIFSIFLDDSSQDVIDMAIHGSRIMGFAFLLNGFNIFSASFFIALDNAKWSLVISSCRGLIFIVVGITVLPLMFETNGVWMTVAVAELCTAVISFYLIKKTLRGK